MKITEQQIKNTRSAVEELKDYIIDNYNNTDEQAQANVKTLLKHLHVRCDSADMIIFECYLSKIK